MSYPAGTRFHDFSLLDLCGSGSVGEVYLANDLAGRLVAVKIISKLRFGDAWQRELKGLTHYRKLAEQHPNLVRIHHLGEDDRCFYYSMDAADDCGEDGVYRPATLSGRRLEVAEVIELGRKLLPALEALHAAGLAHRDLKPANLLLVRGEPQIADLGLLSSELSLQTSVAGTLDFLPPEVRSGQRGQTPEDDFYALGKVLYSALTGNPADLFPSLPAGLKLTPAVKVLNRLLYRVCALDAAQRVTGGNGFRKLLGQAEDQLHHPSHSRIWFADLRQAPWRHFKTTLADLGRGIRKHWLLTAFVLALLTAGSFWVVQLYREAQPVKLPEVDDYHRFKSERFDYAITLPRQWGDMATTMKMKAEQGEVAPAVAHLTTQESALIFQELLQEANIDSIFCGLYKGFTINIVVAKDSDCSMTLSDVFSPQEWGKWLELVHAQIGMSFKVFNIYATTFGDCPAFVYEHSATFNLDNLTRDEDDFVPGTIAEEIHALAVAIEVVPKKEMLYFTLTAPNKVFEQYKERFLQAMATVEILRPEL